MAMEQDHIQQQNHADWHPSVAAQVLEVEEPTPLEMNPNPVGLTPPQPRELGSRRQTDITFQRESEIAPQKVFVMRDEGHEFNFEGIRRRTYTIDASFDRAYANVWETFNYDLGNIVHDALDSDPSTKGTVIESYKLSDLRPQLLQLLGDRYAISTDPCISAADHPMIRSLGMSRIWQIGGAHQFGFGNRPGDMPLYQQADAIKDWYENEFVPLVGRKRVEYLEDDVFSGGTARALVGELRDRGVPVGSAIVCFQVGRPDIGIPIHAVVTHQPDQVVDFADHRDFVVGIDHSGLVVMHDNGGQYKEEPRVVSAKGNGARGNIFAARDYDPTRMAKVPYTLPFVSPHKRSSIPEGAEREFSQQILLANVLMWERLNKAIGRPVTLRHANGHFRPLMESYGFTPDTPMSRVTADTLDNFDALYERIHEQPPVVLPTNVNYNSSSIQF